MGDALPLRPAREGLQGVALAVLVLIAEVEVGGGIVARRQAIAGEPTHRIGAPGLEVDHILHAAVAALVGPDAEVPRGRGGRHPVESGAHVPALALIVGVAVGQQGAQRIVGPSKLAPEGLQSFAVAPAEIVALVPAGVEGEVEFLAAHVAVDRAAVILVRAPRDADLAVLAFKLVLLEDDVEDAGDSFRIVLGGGRGDDFDAVDAAGGNLLKQALGGGTDQAAGTPVDEDGDVAGSTEAQVAVDVDVHARDVAKQLGRVGSGAVEVIAHAEHFAVDHHLEGGALLDDFGGFERLDVGHEPDGAEVLFCAAARGEADVVHLHRGVAHEAELGSEPTDRNLGDAEPAFAVGYAAGDDLVLIEGEEADGGEFDGGAGLQVLHFAKNDTDLGAFTIRTPPGPFASPGPLGGEVQTGEQGQEGHKQESAGHGVTTHGVHQSSMRRSGDSGCLSAGPAGR